MKPQSAKAKGRRLQQEIRDLILLLFPELTKDDVRSTSMGASGEDVLLSQAARKLLPIQIECKNKNKQAVYTNYDQAAEHGDHHPVLIVKQNHREPLAVVDAKLFFQMLRNLNGNL